MGVRPCHPVPAPRPETPSLAAHPWSAPLAGSRASSALLLRWLFRSWSACWRCCGPGPTMRPTRSRSGCPFCRAQVVGAVQVGAVQTARRPLADVADPVVARGATVIFRPHPLRRGLPVRASHRHLGGVDQLGEDDHLGGVDAEPG